MNLNLAPALTFVRIFLNRDDIYLIEFQRGVHVPKQVFYVVLSYDLNLDLLKIHGHLGCLQSLLLYLKSIEVIQVLLVSDVDERLLRLNVLKLASIK